MSHSPGITNLPVPSITVAEAGIVTCLARPTAAIFCPRTRMVMSCCGLPTAGSMMVTCVSARPPDCARTALANPNSAQSTNREYKIDLKRWHRITKLDAKRETFVPAGDERRAHSLHFRLNQHTIERFHVRVAGLLGRPSTYAGGPGSARRRRCDLALK